MVSVFGVCVCTRVFIVHAQIAKAINSIHEMGVIHKDINANNIVLNKQTGKIQVCHHTE